MTERRTVEQCREVVEAIPYCRFLGIGVHSCEGEEMIVRLAYAPHVVGNLMLRAVHGGVIGAFLETAAMLEVMRQLPATVIPKPIDITIAYLRHATGGDTFARTWVTKHGRRVVNVRVEAWQESRERPVATAQGHFLVSGDQ